MTTARRPVAMINRKQRDLVRENESNNNANNNNNNTITIIRDEYEKGQKRTTTQPPRWYERKCLFSVLLLIVIIMQMHTLIQNGGFDFFNNECDDVVSSSSVMKKKAMVTTPTTTTKMPPTTPAVPSPTPSPTTTSKSSLLQNIPSQPKYPHVKVGLCAILKNSTQYLDEWVDYHLFAINFYEIYIYDNSDHFQLKEWIQKRKRQDNNNTTGQRIHVIDYPSKGGQVQIPAYRNCVEKYGKRVDYITFIDDDEFLVLYKHRTVGDFVKEHLVNGSSLTVNWQLFGTSNHTISSPLPVTYRYQYTENIPNLVVKSFVRPQDYHGQSNPHAIYLKNNTHFPHVPTWRDTSRQPGKYNPLGAWNLKRPSKIALLYHYKYKSQQEWNYKACIRQTVSGPKLKGCGEDPEPGVVYDDTAWQILSTRVDKYKLFHEFPDYG